MITVTVTIVWVCSGCGAAADYTYDTPRPERRFRSFSGSDHGVGTWITDKLEIDVVGPAPEGWMPFDPYTSCTYCPACWASIDGPREAEAVL